MTKRKYYDIEFATQMLILIEYMEARMKQGWQPIGGAVYGGGIWFQTVVRTSQPNEELKGQDDE